MAELEQRLQEAADARYRLIATDGVFSMDGVLANLPAICDLAERYDALVMVDDSHAVGFVGAHGRGTHEHSRRDGPGRHHHRHARQGARRRVGRLHRRAAARSSTGCGSARGRTCSPTPWRRSIAAATLRRARPAGRRRRAAAPARTQRRTGSATAMTAAGFTLAGAGHPIIPVMLGDARVAGEMAERLLARRAST